MRWRREKWRKKESQGWSSWETGTECIKAILTREKGANATRATKTERGCNGDHETRVRSASYSTFREDFSHLPSVLWMFMLSPTSMLTVPWSMVIKKSVSVGTIKRRVARLFYNCPFVSTTERDRERRLAARGWFNQATRTYARERERERQRYRLAAAEQRRLTVTKAFAFKLAR